MSTGRNKAKIRKALDKAARNKYTEKVSGERIFYTNEFYSQMRKLMDSGKSPLEAYEALGYDVRSLGEDRAYAAAGRAASGYARKAEKVDGTTPRDQVGSLSDEEMISYLNSRIDYLETVVTVVKKKGSELLVTMPSSKKEK